MGNRSLALDELERAFEERSPNLITLTTLPLFRELQQETRLLDLRKKMRL
jgi:hypothetical protein